MYSFINIAGLALGIACCIFIFLYVRLELSYDSYHPDVERLFRVGLVTETEAGRKVHTTNLIPMGPALKEAYPQIEYAGRVCKAFNQPTVRYQDKIFREDYLLKADSDMLYIFDIIFLHGDPKTALIHPNTAVLTEAFSQRYFGDEDPLGKTFQINSKDFKVAGIVRNPPRNTHLQFECLLSYTITDEPEWMSGWHALATPALTYLKLKPGINPDEFEKLILNAPQTYIGEQLDELGARYTNFLQPVRDIHLYSLSAEGRKPSRNLIYACIFSIAGALILLIASMNFMNLSTARSATRSCEVGIRKVVGAHRHQLVRQFLGESLVTSMVSLLIAIMIAILTFPFYNDLAGTGYTAVTLFQPDIILGLLAIVLLVGTIAGTYPALFLSAFKPVSIFKGTLGAGSRSFVMRRILVISQFAISTILIVSTLIVYRQLHYMRSRPLGFEKDQKLVLTLSGWDIIEDNYDQVKDEFLQHPSITEATASSGVPGKFINRLWMYPSVEELDNGQTPMILRCDQDFTSVYGIKMAAGRPFRKEMGTDRLSGDFIINEAAVRSFGWDSPEESIDRQIMIGSQRSKYTVIGVVEDFHWYGLQNAIEPMVLRFVSTFRYITLNVQTENLPETLTFVEEKYNELFPNQVFEYFFVDTEFDRQYGFEERLGRIFRLFTFLGICIACLGLFGMATFMAQQRTKEIGIRKILGASVPNLVQLFSREFILLVAISNIIAWPIAYYAGRTWLQNFAYRVSLDWWIFILAGLLATGISLCTAGVQSMKVSLANPVDSLRYE
jgi:putative ABC transport system permease protein